MNYKVRNDFLLVENLESTEEPKESTSGIILPNSSKSSVFWRLKVLGVGTKITDVKVGDIVYRRWDGIEKIKEMKEKEIDLSLFIILL